MQLRRRWNQDTRAHLNLLVSTAVARAPVAPIIIRAATTTAPTYSPDWIEVPLNLSSQWIFACVT